jgi:hypothetical protein
MSKLDRDDLYLIKDYLEGLLEDYFLDDPETMKRTIELVERLIEEN